MDKRINFDDESYKLRLELAQLSWNETTGRKFRREKPVSEEKLGVKVLGRKTFNFIHEVYNNCFLNLGDVEEIIGVNGGDDSETDNMYAGSTEEYTLDEMSESDDEDEYEFNYDIDPNMFEADDAVEIEPNYDLDPNFFEDND